MYIYIYIFMIFRNRYWFKKGWKPMNQPGFHGMKLKGLFRLQLLNRWSSHTANQMSKNRTWKESPPDKNQRKCMEIRTQTINFIQFLGFHLFLFFCFGFCLCVCVLHSFFAFEFAASFGYISFCQDSLCHECRLAFLGQRGLYLRMANLCQLQYAICVLHRCGKSGLQSPIESDQ